MMSDFFRSFLTPNTEVPCSTIFTLLYFCDTFWSPLQNITLDVIYERTFARFFFVLDLQKNFRCIAIDCKYFSSFFSDISTIIGREKSRKLFSKEKKLKKLWQYIFAKKAILFCCTSMQNKRKSLGKIRSYFQHYKLGCKVFNGIFSKFLFSLDKQKILTFPACF